MSYRMPSSYVGVAGLPRSGSTLLCQMLGEHPDIHCEGHSSCLPRINPLVRRYLRFRQYRICRSP